MIKLIIEDANEDKYYITGYIAEKELHGEAAVQEVKTTYDHPYMENDPLAQNGDMTVTIKIDAVDLFLEYED